MNELTVTDRYLDDEDYVIGTVLLVSGTFLLGYGQYRLFYWLFNFASQHEIISNISFMDVILVYGVGALLLMLIRLVLMRYQNGVNVVATLILNLAVFSLWPLFIILGVVFVPGRIVIVLGARLMLMLLKCLDGFMARISQRVVHRDEYGVVIDRLLPSGHARFVIVEDKTGKHELPVPVEMERAKQAVAWTYNMAEDEYDPVLRT